MAKADKTTQDQAAPQEEDRFAAVREESTRNAAKDAEVASTLEPTKEQAIKARPEVESSKNPEQVKLAEPEAEEE